MDVDALMTMLTDCDVVDLSQPLEEGMPCYPTHSRFFHNLWESYWHGDRAVTYQVMLNEHSGTHVDAPAHFAKEGHLWHVWIDELGPASLLGRAATVDVRGAVNDGLYDVEVAQRFEASHGPIRPGDVLLFRTGWAKKWRLRPANQDYLAGWPGPTRALCEWIRDRKIRAVGCDNIGFDAAGSADWPGHYTLLESGIPILENLTNLDLLPAFVAFVALPLKIKGGSGSPVRAIAFVPRSRR